MFARLYLALHRHAERLNRSNIREGVRSAALRFDAARVGSGETGTVQDLRLLDLGCDDGLWTLELTQLAGAAVGAKVAPEGVELFEDRAKIARDRGVQVHIQDLLAGLPQGDGTVTIVHANQVIEHLGDIDTFIEEIHRVLAPGGTAIISTENASAWHNIFAAIMGWQIFSLTNVSRRAGSLGNPLALHRGKEGFASTWTHKTIFNYLGLKEIFEVHGFESVEVLGAGYHPLPARMGRWDPRHAHFLTVIARKPVAPRGTTPRQESGLISAYSR